MTPEEQARAMLVDPAMKRAIVEALASERRVSITDLAGRLTPEDCETIALVEHMAWHEGYSAGEADGIGRTNDDAFSREEQVRAEEGERAAIIWRRGVGDTISAIDTIRKEWAASKSKARREVAAEMDARLQQIFDARLLRRPTTYEEAAEAGDALRGAAIRSAPSSQRGD